MGILLGIFAFTLLAIYITYVYLAVQRRKQQLNEMGEEFEAIFRETNTQLVEAVEARIDIIDSILTDKRISQHLTQDDIDGFIESKEELLALLDEWGEGNDSDN